MPRSRRALDAFVSGCIVYALMAACSSSKNMMATSASTSGSGGHLGTGGLAGTGGHGGHTSASSTGSGGTMGMGGTSGDSGIMDALMDPVSDAMAGIENPQSGSRLKGKYVMGADGSKEYQFSTFFGDPHGGNQPGPLAVHPVWYDSVLQEDCTFLPASDGKLYCMPGTPATSSETFGLILIYTDAACTKQVLAQLQPGVGCVPNTAPKYVQGLDQAANCLPTAMPATHVYQVGSPVAQPSVVYIGSPSQCQFWNNPPNAMEWFSVTEVPLTTFVQGSAGIDP